MKHEPSPRLHELASLADVKVQTTKFGAVIQLAAKNAADTAKVQQLANELATDLTESHERPRHAH